jgi:hypothetical protein
VHLRNGCHPPTILGIIHLLLCLLFQCLARESRQAAWDWLFSGQLQVAAGGRLARHALQWFPLPGDQECRFPVWVPAQHNLHHQIGCNGLCYRMPPAVYGSHALAIDRSTSGQLANDTCCTEMLSRLSEDNLSSCRPPAADWGGLANRPSFAAEFHRQRVCSDAQSLPRYDRAVAAACMECMAFHVRQLDKHTSHTPLPGNPLTTVAISRPTSRTSRCKQPRAASSSSWRLLRIKSAPWKTCCCSLCSVEQVHQLTLARSPLRHSACLTPVSWKCSKSSRCLVASHPGRSVFGIIPSKTRDRQPGPEGC